MSTQEWRFGQHIEVTQRKWPLHTYVVLLNGEKLLTPKGVERQFASRERALQTGRREARRRWLALEAGPVSADKPLEFRAEMYTAHAPAGKYVVIATYRDTPKAPPLDGPAHESPLHERTWFTAYYHPRASVPGEASCVLLRPDADTLQAAIDVCMAHARAELLGEVTAPEVDA